MAKGICIFVEHFGGKVLPVVNELLAAAHVVKKATGEPVSALLAGAGCDGLASQLEGLELDEIYTVETGRDMLFQDDAMGTVVAQMVRRIEPSSVLIPASSVGKSIFSRVAAQLGCGLTADCTELAVKAREDGSFYIDQRKPSFGDNVMVSIVTKEQYAPQMMTIRQGVYPPHPAANGTVKVTRLEGIEIPSSAVEVLEKQPAVAHGDSIMGAEIVVVGGRGALEGENFRLLKEFAEKIGAAIGGTRPLADTGVIPFENQIGQTGLTIRPKICISFGVSGAIQHTEGIKDTKLYIAVNTDPEAPIFHTCDYGVVADMQDVLRQLLA